VISARFQCVATIVTLNMGSAQSLGSAGATWGTAGQDAESVRNYLDANMETVPRALNADVKKAGLGPFAL